MPANETSCPVAPITNQADDLLRRQLPWVLFFRIILVTLLLGLTVFLHSRGAYLSHLPPLAVIAIFIVLIHIFTIGSAFVIRFITCSKPFAYLQLCLDVLLTTLLLFFSGGSQSALLIIFFFPIISGATLLLRRGAMFIAALASLCYAAVLWVEYNGLLPQYLPPDQLHSLDIALHRFAIAGLSFFIIAYLSALLAFRLRETEEELSATAMDRDRLALLYRQIFADITTGIITVDNRDKITSFNQAAAKITGFPRETALATPFSRLLPNLARGQEQSSQRAMAEISKADGASIPVGFSWTRLNMPGEVGDYRVYTMQDLSKIREMEEQVQQAEKMAAIGHMAAGIAHEFRNPLAAMSGAAQLLASELSDNHGTRSLTNIIIRESDRLEETIHEFLQFSRPASLESHWFSMTSLANDSLAMARNDPAFQDDIEIAVDIPAGLDGCGDANQLRQVLVNLLSNAFHGVSRAKNPKVSIQARESRQEGEKGLLLITVSDNGQGISEKDLEQIFAPFFTRRDKGTGLGLAIVQQIVASHRGTITVQGNALGGTTFTVKLPLEGGAQERERGVMSGPGPAG